MAEGSMDIEGLMWFIESPELRDSMKDSVIELLSQRKGVAKVWVMGPDGRRKLCPVLVEGERLVVAFSAATAHLCKAGQFITKPVERVQRVGYTSIGGYWVFDLGPDTDEPWELKSRGEMGIDGPDAGRKAYLGLG